MATTVTLTPQQFVHKWQQTELKERSASQEHFIDVCRLIGHPTPAESDPAGERFTFEAGASKVAGGEGFADVWKRGFFAWEYKGKHADLDKAYEQLLKYRESLQNPPLLIVSDMEQFVIHTNFTNTVKRVVPLGLEDLLDPTNLALLRAAFYDPSLFQSPDTPETITAQAAARFGELARILRERGNDPQEVAHFLIRLLFCLYAEDIGLLPEDVFTYLATQLRGRPAPFNQELANLFGAMSTGGLFSLRDIPCFNGGLFDAADVVALDVEALDVLCEVCELDWANIEPSILGTLFERGLDPDKRSQLGAHYTSRDDILLIVEPVLMAPLRRRWDDVRQEAEELAQRRDDAASTRARNDSHRELTATLQGFAAELGAVRVLDPACGSGNFLYVALRQLLDLWKEVSVLGSELGLPLMQPLEGSAPYPTQLHGIEIDPYAHELAQATLWIGYIQWLRENGFGYPAEPILKPVETVLQMDAILAHDEAGNPVEPEWPEADVIVGNPPFLGGKLLRQELGDVYVDGLFALYEGEVAHEADLVCYWFEQARQLLANGKLSRAGLLATQGIRGGANRRVLERIKTTGDIFMAWSDREWVLGGANVHVSMVAFDDGSETSRQLDAKKVQSINPDLTSTVDVTKAARLQENSDLAYMGDTKGGPFDIDSRTAQAMLAALGNPNGRPNSDVVHPWVNGRDVTQRRRRMWIIDFGIDMPAEEAAQYEAPWEYARTNVQPARRTNRRAAYRERWWIHVEARPAMRVALAPLSRYIATPCVAKHRLFAVLGREVLPDHALIAFCRDDDYFFGVLHAQPHELWALRQGTQLETRPRYTPTTTFETYPFPWAPGQEPVGDARVEAIAQAANELVEKRQAWLNPEGATEKELKRRTLTNLYNQRPTWLDLAHKNLDAAVFDAYGWPHELEDEEILERLLALNLERAGEES